MEPKRIREGYLVKKGSMFSTWKPMWVVLLEDGIEFYKKKSDNSPKGMIPLKGSTLTSPCQDFGKRMFVLKITTTKQQDHFFQAAFLEERDAWVRDIKKAIKCIEGGQKFARKSTRRSIRLPETVDLGALYLSMKDTEKGIKELNLEKDKKVFNHCFTGSGVIDWLLSNNLVRNRQEGLMISASLLSEGYLQPAGDLSKNAADGVAENPFLDNPDAFYYFPDSGFFCEENSSDDDVILREEFRGVIIKQGCLLKQGHRRKNWKVRKFILREDPAYLHYYDPAGGEDPLGALHLRGCVVTSVESNPDGKKSDEENLFEIITADEVHYYLQAATPKERTEWIKAIQVASRTGKAAKHAASSTLLDLVTIFPRDFSCTEIQGLTTTQDVSGEVEERAVEKEEIPSEWQLRGNRLSNVYRFMKLTKLKKDQKEVSKMRTLRIIKVNLTGQDSTTRITEMEFTGRF